MPQIDSVEKFISEKQSQSEAELFELLRIKSVSADSRLKDEVRKAGQWVEARLARIGLKTELVETAKHPIVYAESPKIPGKPTVLVYGHYDVQPPDPENEWKSPPFEPTVRDGNVFARGSSDDKGQMLTHVLGADAWISVTGSLPVQLKFVIEGEEEVGSESLYAFLESRAASLTADVAVISDTAQFARGQPAITYGLRGLAYFELFLQGPKQDLHSGTFGGGVTNPANVLAEMIASLKDPDGKVLIPGFYDDVLPLSQRERDQYAALPFTDENFMKQVGVTGLFGEKGYSTLERRSARPTMDVNGLTSGYQGEGAKTVLPAKASAKFSCRLVPNQDPSKVGAALEAKLKSLCPPGIQMKLVAHHGAPGVVIPLESPFVSAAARAIEHGFGNRPVFIREGGSIPVVTALRQKLKIDTLLLGWGLDDDNLHSPNEKFSLADYQRGIRTSARLWHEMAAM
jgi:acetylornithine deacetylase/succinyl-diaminopimelate desuccinylase-like protein